MYQETGNGNGPTCRNRRAFTERGLAAIGLTETTPPDAKASSERAEPPSPEGKAPQAQADRRKRRGNHKRPKSSDAGRSKKDRVLEMLRRPDGATISAIMKATGWQQHSIRGFFAGVVRKKLGLPLLSDKTERGRTYRIPLHQGSKRVSKAQRRA